MFFYQWYYAGAIILLCFGFSRFFTLWLSRKSLDTLGSIVFAVPGALCSAIGMGLGYMAMVEAHII